MKKVAPLAVLMLAAVFMATTGFQCGSAETTSAKLYMQQKQYDKAEASLLKEVGKNDKNEEAWFLLGQIRAELKRYIEMEDAFKHALAAGETHKAEIQRYRLGVWVQQYNEGVRLFNLAHEDPANYDKAIDVFKIAIAMEPDSATTYYVSALPYYNKKDMAGAVKMLELALQKKPDYSEAAHLLGQVHYQMGVGKLADKDTTASKAEFAAATTAFEAAYKAEPDSIVNITSLIDIYERTNNTPKALSITKDAVEKDPSNKVFRYAYGVFLLKQDKFEQSAEQFQKALDIDPNYSDARYNLGVTYLNWGVTMKRASDDKFEADQKKAGKGKQVKADESYREKFKIALPYLEKSAEIRSDDAALWQQLGRLYLVLNMPEKSKAAFERMDKLSKGQ